MALRMIFKALVMAAVLSWVSMAAALADPSAVGTTSSDPVGTPAPLAPLETAAVSCDCMAPTQWLGKVISHRSETYKLRPLCKYLSPEANLSSCGVIETKNSLISCECSYGEDDKAIVVAPTNRLDDLLNECRDIDAAGLLKNCAGM